MKAGDTEKTGRISRNAIAGTAVGAVVLIAVAALALLRPSGSDDGKAEERREAEEARPPAGAARKAAPQLTQRHVEEIRALYQQGQGEEACRLIDAYGLQDELGGLKRRIALVSQCLKAGRQAVAEKRYADAVAEYREVVAVESDAKNQYVIKAKSLLHPVCRIVPQYAEDLAAEGMKALVSGNAEEARARFEEAYRLDRTNADAIRGLRNLQREAADFYNRASLLPPGNAAMALGLLEKALERAEPAGELHAAIQKKIRACKTLLGID